MSLGSLQERKKNACIQLSQVKLGSKAHAGAQPSPEGARIAEPDHAAHLWHGKGFCSFLCLPSLKRLCKFSFRCRNLFCRTNIGIILSISNTKVRLKLLDLTLEIYLAG